MSEVSRPSLMWSTQLTVSNKRSRDLSGDKVLLPPFALEQLLTASSALAVETARRALPQYDPYNTATYSAYKRAESQFQDQNQQLPYPLTFRLVNPENGRVIYAGVKEFSASENEIVLSPFVREALGFSLEEHEPTDGMDVDHTYGSKQVMVHARELPKGTYVKLRPLEAGYNPEDWKALLEQYLRQNYTTLTHGEMLVVPGGKGISGKREQFRFLVDGFKPEADGVCIVDTDLEVDIEALNEEQARETLERIAEKMKRAPGSDPESSGGGEIDIFRAQEGQVVPGEYIDYQLPSWSKSQPLMIDLRSVEDDAELELLVSPFTAIQRARPRIDEYVFGELDSQSRKRIRLEPTNVELDNAEALFITIHAFGPHDIPLRPDVEHAWKPIRFTLRASHPSPNEGSESSVSDVKAVHAQDDMLCENCQQWVPKQTIVLHENFCLRNNVRCTEGCTQVFDKRSPARMAHWHCPFDSSCGNTHLSHEKHDKLFHPSPVLRCSECSTAETFPSMPSLARHKTTTCPAKSILCRFCHLEVPQEGDPDVPNAEALLSGLTSHEIADGSRTTECHLCGKIVRLRDMDTHLRNHDLDRASRPPPIVCRNVNCGRTLDTCSKTGDTRAGTRMGQGSGNDIGICSVCFGPLYVSMHDPENKALRRRIERRYLRQLLTGCGKGWCRNEFCANGRKASGNEVKISTKDALPIVKPVMDALAQGHGDVPLHFCVDEQSHTRRILGEMLDAEQGGILGKAGAYDFNWYIGALEAENGDLDAARVWLKNWAPNTAEQERTRSGR